MKTKMRKYEEGGDVVDETGMSFGTIKRNTETGELYDTEGSFKPVPKSMPVTETKAKTEPKKESKKETKEESKAESKKSAKEQAKEVIKPPKLPESFEKAGGGKERAKAKVDSGTFSFSKIAKNLRERAGITSYKSGGSVSSASKRADGIAQRGKTRA